MSDHNLIDIPIATPTDRTTPPVVPRGAYLCNDVSWPLAFIHSSGLAQYQYRLEYCRLSDQAIIRELVYTVNDKRLILRYRISKCTD